MIFLRPIRGERTLSNIYIYIFFLNVFPWHFHAFYIFFTDLIRHIEMFFWSAKQGLNRFWVWSLAKNRFFPEEVRFRNQPWFRNLRFPSAIGFLVFPERDFPKVSPKSLEIPAVLDLSGELRVSFAPSTVLKLRRMGFSILLETSAGASAGFSDEDYTRRGRTYGAPGWKWCWWISTGQTSLHIFVLVWICLNRLT